VLFNIIGLNSADNLYTNIAPIVQHIREIFSLCGYDSILSHNMIEDNAINIFLEHFPDNKLLNGVIEYKKNKGGLFGIFATELMLEGTMPWSLNGCSPESVDANGPRIAQRMSGFHDFLPVADFVWTFLERTAETYASQVPIIEHFSLAYAKSAPNEAPLKLLAPKDIDVLFCGAMTPYRRRILKTFEDRGIAVVACGSGTALGRLPAPIYESYLDRAKIGLSVTFGGPPTGLPEDEAIGLTDKNTDLRFASCSRIPEMLLRDVCILSEEIPLDNPYADFMVQTPGGSMADMCASLLENDLWQHIGAANSAAWRRDMNALVMNKPVIDRTIEKLKMAQARSQTMLDRTA